MQSILESRGVDCNTKYLRYFHKLSQAGLWADPEGLKVLEIERGRIKEKILFNQSMEVK